MQHRLCLHTICQLSYNGALKSHPSRSRLRYDTSGTDIRAAHISHQCKTSPRHLQYCEEAGAVVERPGTVENDRVFHLSAKPV